MLQPSLLRQLVHFAIGSLIGRSVGIESLQQMQCRRVAAAEKPDKIGRRVKQRTIVNVQELPPERMICVGYFIKLRQIRSLPPALMMSGHFTAAEGNAVLSPGNETAHLAAVACLSETPAV